MLTGLLASIEAAGASTAAGHSAALPGGRSYADPSGEALSKCPRQDAGMRRITQTTVSAVALSFLASYAIEPVFATFDGIANKLK